MAKAPKTIGPYELGDLIGRGGMGEVYRAKHTILDRQVALKRLIPPDDASQAETYRERFIREGKALAKLQHESVIAVYDLIEQRGDLWLAMEIVDGFGLDDLTKAGALPIDVACMIGASVARALEAAHHADILHRDVKPANILVSQTGVVKLMDFGVAKDENLDGLTKTGGVVGTPSYMAPELLKGQPATARSDIYALGAVLYELLSGRRVFAHATPDSIWGLIATGKFPRLGKVAPHVPWQLTLLVERCLKLDPKRRPSSASDLRQQLERFLSEHTAPADENARLVSWLCATGKVAESLALTVVQDTSFFVEVVPLKRRAQPWRTAALVSILATGLMIALIAKKTDLLDGVIATVRGIGAAVDETRPPEGDDEKPEKPNGDKPYRSPR